MTTVLSKNSASDFASARLLARLQESYQQKATEKVGVVSDRYQSKINSINRDTDQWRGVKKDIGKTTSEVSFVTSRAKGILSKLDAMIRTVNQAEQASKNESFQWAGFAAAFDSQLKGVEMDANRSTTDTVNLLGSGEPDLKYNTTPWGDPTTVEGAYLGNDFVIVEADGKRWKPDADAKLLRQYDTDGKATGKVGSYDDLTKDSWSGTSISFTMNADTATPETISGTLEQKGMSLLNAWAYDSLSTSAGRTKALEDLNSAKLAAQLEVKRYEAAQATAAFYEERANANIKGLREESNSTLIEQARRVGELQDELAREYQTTTSSVALAMSARKGFAQIFSQFTNSNPITKALMNIVT